MAWNSSSHSGTRQKLKRHQKRRQSQGSQSKTRTAWSSGAWPFTRVRMRASGRKKEGKVWVISLMYELLCTKKLNYPSPSPFRPWQLLWPLKLLSSCQIPGPCSLRVLDLQPLLLHKQTTRTHHPAIHPQLPRQPANRPNQLPLPSNKQLKQPLQLLLSPPHLSRPSLPPHPQIPTLAIPFWSLQCLSQHPKVDSAGQRAPPINQRPPKSQVQRESSNVAAQ